MFPSQEEDEGRTKKTPTEQHDDGDSEMDEVKEDSPSSRRDITVVRGAAEDEPNDDGGSDSDAGGAAGVEERPYSEMFVCHLCEAQANQDGARAENVLGLQYFAKTVSACANCKTPFTPDDVADRGVWACPVHTEVVYCAACTAALIREEDGYEVPAAPSSLMSVVLMIMVIGIGGTMLLLASDDSSTHSIFARPCVAETFSTSSSSNGYFARGLVPDAVVTGLTGANPISGFCGDVSQRLASLGYNASSSTVCGAAACSQNAITVPAARRESIAWNCQYNNTIFISANRSTSNVSTTYFNFTVDFAYADWTYVDRSKVPTSVIMSVYPVPNRTKTSIVSYSFNVPLRIPTQQCLPQMNVTVAATKCVLYNHESAVASPYLFMVFGAAKVVFFLLLGNFVLTPFVVTPLKSRWMYAKLRAGELASWPRMLRKFAAGIPAPRDHADMHRFFPPEPTNPWHIHYPFEERELLKSEDGAHWRGNAAAKARGNALYATVRYVIRRCPHVVPLSHHDSDLETVLATRALDNFTREKLYVTPTPEGLIDAVATLVEPRELAAAVATDMFNMLGRDTTLPIAWVLSRTMALLLAHHHTSFSMTGQGYDAQWSPHYDVSRSAMYKDKLQAEIDASGIDLNLDRDIVSVVGRGEDSFGLFFSGNDEEPYTTFVSWHHALARLDIRPVYSFHAQLQRQLADGATPGLLFVLIGLASTVVQVAYSVYQGWQVPLGVDMHIYFRIAFRLSQNGAVTGAVLKWIFYRSSLKYRKASGEALGAFARLLLGVHWFFFIALFFVMTLPMMLLGIYYSPYIIVLGFDFFAALLFLVEVVAEALETSSRNRRPGEAGFFANPLPRKLVHFALLSIGYSVVWSMVIQLPVDIAVQQWIKPPSDSFIEPLLSDIRSRKIACSVEGVSDIVFQQLSISLLP